MTVRPRLRNPTQLLRDTRPRWEGAGFTNSDARDTKIRAIAQPLLEEIYTLSEENQRAYLDLQLGTARGKQLEDIGRSMGKPKFTSSFANVSSSESSLAFYVTAGTFGDINGALDINLPATVSIWVDGNENDRGERVTFKLNQATTLPAGASIIFVSATCTADGAIGNVAAQTLRNHDFTGYADSPANGLKVVNFFPILNGTGEESDERYRGRLISHFRSLASSNFDALQVQSLAVPGVRTTQLRRGYFGIGTGAIFVNGPEGRSNSRMVQGVQQAIQHSTPPGGELQALPMVQVSVDMEVVVKTTSAISASRQQQIEAELRRVFLRYLRDALASTYIDFSEYQRRAVQALSPLGVVFSKENFFRKIYVGRSYGGGSSDERSLLTGTQFSLDINEYPSLGTFTVSFE